jgi:transcriptional regulator GlxA family with amidase domain
MASDDVAAFFALMSVFQRCAHRFISYPTTQELPSGVLGISIGGSGRFSEYGGPRDTLIAIGDDGAVEPQTPELLGWRRERSSHNRRIASVCTGAFILVATSLVDGRRVTVHWRFCDLCVSRYQHFKESHRLELHALQEFVKSRVGA